MFMFADEHDKFVGVRLTVLRIYLHFGDLLSARLSLVTKLLKLYD